MSGPYEEIVHGEVLMRAPPGARHETICLRLHRLMAASLSHTTTRRLLAPRSVVRLTSGTMVRPDLALVSTGTGKLWLAAEIINSEDHRTDTVVKKEVYEDMNVPRLWMIDPRYDNVEIYHSSEYGLVLKGILAGREVLTEQDLPEFRLTIADLFRMETAPG